MYYESKNEYCHCIGGVAGGVIGHQLGNTANGAIIGAAVGGTTGALIGRHMDRQAEEMRQDVKNAKIERIGELNPIASNDTDYGRQQNRRVEVAIFANDKLKKTAENGNLN